MQATHLLFKCKDFLEACAYWFKYWPRWLFYSQSIIYIFFRIIPNNWPYGSYISDYVKLSYFLDLRPCGMSKWFVMNGRAPCHIRSSLRYNLLFLSRFVGMAVVHRIVLYFVSPNTPRTPYVKICIMLLLFSYSWDL